MLKPLVSLVLPLRLLINAHFSFLLITLMAQKKTPDSEKAYNIEIFFFLADLSSSQNTLFDTQTKALSPTLNNSELFSVELYCIC